MTNSGPDCGNCEFEKVVIHLEDGVIKGFLDKRAANALDPVLRNFMVGFPPSLRIRLIGQDAVQEIPTQSAKAIFFVKDFGGDPQHKSLLFYSGAPISSGVWIRLVFEDGEIMEGLVQNTGRFLMDAAFLMRPTDPYSNNRLVYVVKSWVRECHILGLRLAESDGRSATSALVSCDGHLQRGEHPRDV